jgi:hypothetical protein
MVLKLTIDQDMPTSFSNPGIQNVKTTQQDFEGNCCVNSSKKPKLKEE